MSEKPNLVVLLGPTAAGKTRLAARLARERGGEIISADSRQVYRGMDIGTGKDRRDYVAEGAAVPVHLLDVADPREEFHLFAYQGLFYRAFSEISARGALPILVGGSGMYLEAAIRGYEMAAASENLELRRELAALDMGELAKRLLSMQPELHNRTDLVDRHRLVRAIEIATAARGGEGRPGVERPVLRPLVIGVRWERDVLRRRITARLHERLAAGMVEEVTTLHQSGVGWERLDRFGLEYRYVGLYLQGRLDYDEMVRTLNTRIHQFAKRQDTWFRRMERRGVTIHWIPGGDYAGLRSLVEREMGPVRQVERRGKAGTEISTASYKSNFKKFT